MAARALAIAFLAAAALAGCRSHTIATGGTPGSGPAPPEANAVPYTLYTHCGIDWEMIAGRWFEAQPPLSDGAGNPPPGWGNPYQAGTIRMLSATRAQFSDAAGHTIILVLRSTATGPPHLCD